MTELIERRMASTWREDWRTSNERHERCNGLRGSYPPLPPATTILIPHSCAENVSIDLSTAVAERLSDANLAHTDRRRRLVETIANSIMTMEFGRTFAGRSEGFSSSGELPL